jgi:hypothetical protein
MHSRSAIAQKLLISLTQNRTMLLKASLNPHHQVSYHLHYLGVIGYLLNLHLIQNQSPTQRVSFPSLVEVGVMAEVIAIRLIQRLLFEWQHPHLHHLIQIGSLQRVPHSYRKQSKLLLLLT